LFGFARRSDFVCKFEREDLGESSSEKKKEIFYISRNIFTIEIDYYFLGIENDEKLMFMISIVLILRM